MTFPLSGDLNLPSPLREIGAEGIGSRGAVEAEGGIESERGLGQGSDWSWRRLGQRGDWGRGGIWTEGRLRQRGDWDRGGLGQRSDWG